jgi:Zn-dependent peptidase ImmA (M78 family)
MTPEEEAYSFLTELGIDEFPIIPREICDRLGIFYIEEPLRSIDGALVISDRGNLISVNSAISEDGRKHFTGAHELGHLCLHSSDQSEFWCSREDIESFRKRTQPVELEANRFAAEFLMPKFLFHGLVEDRDPDWDYIKTLTQKTETTLLATAKRFIDLTTQASVLIVSKNGVISWFNPSKSFRAYVDMDSRVISPNTVAYGVHHGTPPPNNYEVVKADNWVTGQGVNANTEILEWTLPMNSYGQVLTILLDEEGIKGWIKEGFEDDADDGDDEVSTEWELPTFHKSKRKR